MLYYVVLVAVSIWITSSLFMVASYINAKVSLWREGKVLRMPLSFFLYAHFCPIVHTKNAIRILNRMFELRAERRGA